MKKHRVLLVDDHSVIRHGIRSYFKNLEDFDVVAEADCGERAFNALNSMDVDLIFMDISMKEMDGISATKKIKELFPEIKVIALSMMMDSSYIRNMIDAGADGYLFKDCKEEEILKAARSVMDGDSYYCSSATKNIISSYKDHKTNEASVNDPHLILTPREKEVLRLIIDQKSNKEISEELFISLRTVDAHKRNLLEKTGQRNVAGLVMYAIKHKLFDDIKV
ncbi:response regulator transcription factor [Flammeovirga yaeyamensis]|uniref:Response regulator transcription factor n=1 Tax=Flammeovirga yaeyamensis TaxID=367791 RepID=A0AAX1N998_9BACT|nr:MULTISPECIES: response regulator transcription factor [Flammeovirga]ANQ48796.1 response regulator transcription factor [Flammeovirga sp. MY04]MBB3698876.1 DNA-binding NarL/FixJ family response regulator [Flammeovirga yaeyamensis]NMF37461.1 response regulator transcription factor [Flammeovirga yaeyamensis]QWG03726.1 response regulator transcription factor [Flammeovirga yaeyamensis]